MDVSSMTVEPERKYDFPDWGRQEQNSGLREKSSDSEENSDEPRSESNSNEETSSENVMHESGSHQTITTVETPASCYLWEGERLVPTPHYEKWVAGVIGSLNANASSTKQPVILPSKTPPYSPQLRRKRKALPEIQTSRSSAKKKKKTDLVRSPSGEVCPQPACRKHLSTLWRSCNLDGRKVHFCNACGLRFKKGKYCPFCFYIYYDSKVTTEGWIQCSKCELWMHRYCYERLTEHKLPKDVTDFTCPPKYCDRPQKSSSE